MTPTHIIIHCSASQRGNAEMIDRWHRERGFARIGYHFVIGNGNGSRVGEVEKGRERDQPGAHAIGFNNRSLGICLVGPSFAADQILAAVALVRNLMQQHRIPPENVLGHRETRADVELCPGIDMDRFRDAIALEVAL